MKKNHLEELTTGKPEFVLDLDIDGLSLEMESKVIKKKPKIIFSKKKDKNTLF